MTPTHSPDSPENFTHQQRGASASRLSLFAQRTLSMTLSVFFCADMAPAWARSSRDEAQRLFDDRRISEQAKDMSRRAPLISLPPPPTSIPDSQVDASDVAETGPSFLITDIVLLQDSLLSQAERLELTAPFIGQHFGPKRIDMLLRRITAAYLDRGYVTTLQY